MGETVPCPQFPLTKYIFRELYDRLCAPNCVLTDAEMAIFDEKVDANVREYCAKCTKDGSMRLITQIFIKALLGDGIRVLASDFDGTFIRYQSGGSWDPKNDKKSFLTSITPDIMELCEHWGKLGYDTCIVTYSDADAFERRGRISGTHMIDAVLEASNPPFKLRSIYAYWPPYWNSEKRYERLGLKGPMPDGKSYHLGLVKKELGVNTEQVVLLDDDLTNCQIGKQQGYLVFNPYEARGFYLDKLELYVP